MKTPVFDSITGAEVQICRADIESAFAELKRESASRERIADWASRLMHADDAETLSFDPPAAEEHLRDAFQYLMGVDLRTSPDTYLHNKIDFEVFFEQWRQR